ncbi:hypothetical protein HNY73_000018 [Argiope bruennichi]|uniref:Uncharacterized protein n=1 Tax=Argiope bruennichi TaxID=94029 RepID=A0A8T0FXV2_ARGBR|nr:hypothetical protein HNY73_000018 [Argiope bruennichi]
MPSAAALVNTTNSEWENLRAIERVPIEDIDRIGYYLPQRPVIKETSETSKNRPVFDASAKEGNGPSMDDNLIKGPNLSELIPDIVRSISFKCAITSSFGHCSGGKYSHSGPSHHLDAIRCEAEHHLLGKSAGFIAPGDIPPNFG